MKQTDNEKSLKPSQRRSITEYSTTFGSGSDYKSKALRRKILRFILIAICALALIYCGFFLTEILLRISETAPEEMIIKPESVFNWISYLTTHH